MTAGSTIDAAEAEFFGALASDWWDPAGSSAMLHRINPLRLGYIRDAMIAQGRDARSRRILDGMTALDVGCGAGLLAEPLARMGAKVTGVDAAAENIIAATTHAAANGLDITYRGGEVGNLLGSFDLVTCMEVIEHISDRPAFLAELRRLTAPGGTLILSTPNRTPLSYAALIVGAELIARTIPKGAHDWHKFVTPDELTAELATAGFTVTGVTGMTWRPGTGFVLGRDVSVNYYLTALPA